MSIRARYVFLPLVPILATAALIAPRTPEVRATPVAADCHRSYPDFCIPSPPPDLDCRDINGKKPFRVLSPDPHRFDGDKDGWACEPPRRRN